MRITVMAWRSREAARGALDGGDYRRAFRLALDAERVHRTPGGGALVMLTKWLAAIARGNSGCL